MLTVPNSEKKRAPLIVHIIHRLAMGGLENGLVNLINHIPPDRYRHAIVCMTSYTDFRNRIERRDVSVIALHKREGNDFSVYPRIWRILRSLRPDILHNRNISGLELLIPGFLAGVPGRVHGEHGRDIYELNGRNIKYNLLRRFMSLLVHRYITVSNDLMDWLVHTVGIDVHRVTRIYNGVDVQRFHPRVDARKSLGPDGFATSTSFVVGTVGRMQKVKDQVSLVHAFLHLLNAEKKISRRLRLVIIGEGPLRQESQKLLHSTQAEQLAWLPGERVDIPEIMRNLDLFVLPSLNEGISNTILEAMASGLPVVATRVGGNPELVDDESTGMLVPPEDPIALAEAIRTYFVNKEKLLRHGEAGREKAEARFSIESMVKGYLAVYDAVLNRKNPMSVGEK